MLGFNQSTGTAILTHMLPPLPILQTQLPPGMIDLGLGNPPLSLLPLETIRAAAQKALSQNDHSILQYGLEQGNGYFRLALADFLSKEYGFQIVPESLFITTGISNGLDLLCTLFTEAGDVIFVEEPSYFLALKIFADHRLRVISIKTDEEGLRLDTLEEQLKRNRPKFLYIIPTHQNPTGRTLTLERRTRLVELAQRHNFLILADEVYHLLNYRGKPPPPFGAYVHIPNVISLGSFSKILAPGLRLGWIQAHPTILRRLTTSGLLDSGGGLNPFTSAVVREVIESGDLKRNINRLIEVFSHRLLFMDTVLRKQLPETIYTTPAGGYFFWICLPETIDTVELRKKAQTFKVDIRPGALFSSQNGLKNYMRLCFVFHEENEIEEGIVRLKRCLQGK
ncbi:MAG TPA: PLP-dependent aminotransferase family protein [Anaerolineales bacterium]|nr:PLP-dependent aminotransferase family protein [Anaerolineales bacterium]